MLVMDGMFFFGLTAVSVHAQGAERRPSGMPE